MISYRQSDLFKRLKYVKIHNYFKNQDKLEIIAIKLVKNILFGAERGDMGNLPITTEESKGNLNVLPPEIIGYAKQGLKYLPVEDEGELKFSKRFAEHIIFYYHKIAYGLLNGANSSAREGDWVEYKGSNPEIKKQNYQTQILRVSNHDFFYKMYTVRTGNNHMEDKEITEPYFCFDIKI